jgi:hypothetical protein
VLEMGHGLNVSEEVFRLSLSPAASTTRPATSTPSLQEGLTTGAHVADARIPLAVSDPRRGDGATWM